MNGKIIQLHHLDIADILTIDEMFTDSDDFYIDHDNYELAPDESFTLNVTFIPSDGILYENYLTFISNDPSDPELLVSLNGNGIFATDINIDPLSISSDLYTGDIDVHTVTISNNGK